MAAIERLNAACEADCPPPGAERPGYAVWYKPVLWDSEAFEVWEQGMQRRAESRRNLKRMLRRRIGRLDG